MNIIYAGLIGAFLGLIFHMIRNNKEIKKPKNKQNSFYLGFIFDMVTGMFGAILMITVIAPIHYTELDVFLLRTLVGAIIGEGILTHLELKKKDLVSKHQNTIDDKLDDEL
ncbi:MULTISPECIES: DUF4257 domain-containing protein [Alkalihalophilus]|uniref:DUF4257 domain-containing protein n=1 Tax=Alkalihalophilus pseudofirmus (strain ATCC BAA-2126 / JCM 17055 / OF4) TaxID=398511 RepID=D3G1D2_ALKPO|nr:MULTISPECIES: DUF4257 domain-containing protein [Alkalihalophilus]ADC52158.1 hypothetical protein BpOF4_20814 [Alkalihalophilus pseudofirmus OF4]MEC2074203.1 DUF4257 domain-containing protein [Alkalihalophilus marmarensis]